MQSEVIVGRVPEAAVERQFVTRWSPRSFGGEAVPREQLAALFEAARWSPSCYNEQPWLFVYATNPDDRRRVQMLLVEANRGWASKAPVLGVVFARRHFTHNGKPNRWGPFDSGAASFALSLQAQAMGLATHFMGGFDESASYDALGVSQEEYEAMAAFAIGRRGEATLLDPALREREKPSGRKGLGEIAFEGRYRAR